MFRLPLVLKNTHYAITNRRLIFRGGFWGTSFKSINLNQIQESEVKIGFLERLCHVGTICVFSGTTTRKGSRVHEYFIGISGPYEAFREIRDTTEINGS